MRPIRAVSGARAIKFGAAPITAALPAAYEQLTETIEPALTDLHNPTPGFLAGISPFGLSFLATIDNVGNVAVCFDDPQVLGTSVARVSTQMLVAPMHWIFEFDQNGTEHLIKPSAIIDIGCGHDERQRDATSVHQQVPLAAFFPPIRRVGSEGFFGKRSFHHRPINALPSPSDAFHLLMLGQPCAPQRFKETSLFPLEKALMNRTGAAKTLAGQSFPLAAGAQHIHNDNGLEHQSGGRTACPVSALAAGPTVLPAARIDQLPSMIGHVYCSRYRSVTAHNAARIDSLRISSKAKR